METKTFKALLPVTMTMIAITAIYLLAPLRDWRNNVMYQILKNNHSDYYERGDKYLDYCRAYWTYQFARPKECKKEINHTTLIEKIVDLDYNEKMKHSNEL